MDHIVYLDTKAKELQNLLNGTKTAIIRGATGRKMPYGRVSVGDALYFIENNGDGLIKAKATVSEFIQTEKLTEEESKQLVDAHEKALQLNSGLYKRFAGKRYLIILFCEHIEAVTPFKINRSEYSNMDDWLPVGDIKTVMS